MTTTEGSHKEYDYRNNIKECCTGTTTASEKTLTKNKKKILVVDDEADITSLLRKVLIKGGFSVMSTMMLLIRWRTLSLISMIW